MKSYGKVSITSKVVYFLFLDPSVNTTGWSLYKIDFDAAGDLATGKYWKERLVDYGLLRNFTDNTLAAITSCGRQVIDLINKSKVDAVIVETPEIIYAGKMDMKKLLAKAASTLETAMAAAAMLVAAQCSKKDTAMIRPREWQMGHARPKKVDSKVWSMTVANSILAQAGFATRLHTKNDENVADAIAMGSLLMKPIFSQQVLFS